MKAAVGTPNGLELRDIAEPQAKPHELKVKVKAAATVGLEWAGEVVEVGAEVRDFKPGDRVMCGGSGGYAEYAVADHGRTMRIPDGMDFKQAATLPVALNTMHDALVTNGRLKAGESVLIQGASSGVGLMGLQIAKLKGARLVMGSSTNHDRRGRLKEFGADLAVDTRDAAWPDQVLEATGGKGVSLIVDMVSGGTVNPAMRATALLGRIVNVGRLGGAKMEFDFDLHAMRRIDYIGVTFRTRTLEEIRDIVRRMKEDLWDAVSARKLRLPIDRTFPLEQAVEAQAAMRANKHFGKIALTME
jgi:NADPH2:quinone reductase